MSATSRLGRANGTKSSIECCFISINWRGRALATRQIIVDFIGAATTITGLKIAAELNLNIYPTGKKITNAEMVELNIQHTEFQPIWNYCISSK